VFSKRMLYDISRFSGLVNSVQVPVTSQPKVRESVGHSVSQSVSANQSMSHSISQRHSFSQCQSIRQSLNSSCRWTPWGTHDLNL